MLIMLRGQLLSPGININPTLTTDMWGNFFFGNGWLEEVCKKGTRLKRLGKWG
jgi:hypothetical protein